MLSTFCAAWNTPQGATVVTDHTWSVKTFFSPNSSTDNWPEKYEALCCLFVFPSSSPFALTSKRSLMYKKSFTSVSFPGSLFQLTEDDQRLIAATPPLPMEMTIADADDNDVDEDDAVVDAIGDENLIWIPSKDTKSVDSQHQPGCLHLLHPHLHQHIQGQQCIFALNRIVKKIRYPSKKYQYCSKFCIPVTN